MPKLRILESANQDLVDIFKYVARQSGSIETARQFVEALRSKCRHLASLPGQMGRARPELGTPYRSSAYRGYIIYFQYREGALEVGNILEGHRDQESHLDIANDPDLHS